MKKILFVAFAATLLAAGCQKTEIINRVGDRIGFTTELGKITKSVGEADADNDGDENLLAQDFRVWAYYVAADANTGANANDNYDGMVDKLVKAPETIEEDGQPALTGWTPDKTYYWPGKEKDLKFFAVSGVEEGEAEVNETDNKITIAGFTVDTDAADVDLMVADFIQQDQGDKGDPADDAPGKVHFKFNHALSKVEFLFKKAKDTKETIFVQSLTVGTATDTEGGLINVGTLTASTDVDGFGEEATTAVQHEVTLEWDTDSSDPVPFADDWTKKATTEADGYPAEYTAIGGRKVTVGDEGEKAMVVEETEETFTTWLMIPQTIYDETSEIGKTVTITYLINDRQFKVIFPLYVKETLQDWAINQYVRYNVTLSPNKITFGASVNDWKEGRVNLDESDPVYTVVVPATPETGGTEE